MAPCMTIQKAAGQAEHEIRKLRKPVIEKMRRDRINSSIEQLRTLLEKEFHKHQLPSKPEKADILEMTVTFLQQQLAGKYVSKPSQAHAEGYRKSVQDSVNYLSGYDQRHQNKLMKHFNTHQTASQELSHATMYSTPSTVESIQTDPGQSLHNNRKSLWRPW
ncbi:transcription factor HES-5-like [Spea bombifrons]|uniref:transcription factor HES-5-like n=1 Tax=Spea bombifrons TaxID=233779 RepID=UPI00234AC3AA|nr:transcription factor HES-5-like [Spea bombifrons]